MIKRICFHSTAGAYALDRASYNAYHHIVDDAGTIWSGRFRPDSNTPPLKPGHYAAHCGDGNSYTLGIAMTGMSKNLGHGKWNHPHTRIQFERAWELAASYCHLNNIIVTPSTVYTHAEFGQKNPGSSSSGKIDITFIPFMPSVRPEDVGAFFRDKVDWYLKRLSR